VVDVLLRTRTVPLCSYHRRDVARTVPLSTLPPAQQVLERMRACVA
jgi:hypothetical protein